MPQNRTTGSHSGCAQTGRARRPAIAACRVQEQVSCLAHPATYRIESVQPIAIRAPWPKKPERKESPEQTQTRVFRCKTANRTNKTGGRAKTRDLSRRPPARG